MGQTEEILGLFDDWDQALRSGAPDRVAGLYAADAILVPTLSDRLRRNRAEVKDYYELLVRQGISASAVEHNVRVYGDVAVNSGVYAVTLARSGGTPEVMRARFTFVYRRSGGRWLIVEHHSSRMPESPA